MEKTQIRSLVLEDPLEKGMAIHSSILANTPVLVAMATHSSCQYSTHFQCSYPLQSYMDRGAWWATVHAAAESDMTQATKGQHHHQDQRLPWWLSKESACNAGDLGSIPVLRISPGEGDGYPLQYFELENPMDRGAWQATVPEVTKSQTRLSN